MGKNTTLAIDQNVRNKLNRLIIRYNSAKKRNEIELTAKDFISFAVDYFSEHEILKPFASDCELWKDISESENMYQISNRGRVKRKSYIQEFNAVRYTNGENGLISKQKIVKRIYNERIINPYILNGRRCIKFSNGNTLFLDDIIDKYWKQHKIQSDKIQYE